MSSCLRHGNIFCGLSERKIVQQLACRRFCHSRTKHFLPTTRFEHLTQHLSVTTLAGFGIEQNRLPSHRRRLGAHMANRPSKLIYAIFAASSSRHNGDFLQLDTISQQNFGIFKPVLASGISLLSVIDHCQTPMGKRALGASFAPTAAAMSP